MSRPNSLDAKVAAALSGGRMASHGDLLAMGIPRVSVGRLVKRGVLATHGRGVYVLGSHYDGDPLPALALRYGGTPNYPQGVVCLQLAAHLHGLTDLGLWNIPQPAVAFCRTSTMGVVDGLAARIVKLRLPHPIADLEWREFNGHGIHVTTSARTVCDLFAPWAGDLPEGMASEALGRLLAEDAPAAERAVMLAGRLGWGDKIAASHASMLVLKRFSTASEEDLKPGGMRL